MLECIGNSRVNAGGHSMVKNGVSAPDELGPIDKSLGRYFICSLPSELVGNLSIGSTSWFKFFSNPRLHTRRSSPSMLR